ncbi:retropepsin-like aspartic protease family protein [Allosphingosinicella indica]|uniref:Aspartyl protease family protein n=1 Tax=Allosphingosinicella indica TaxID=941907 RepID=A0A1X7FYF9_9SPHN|nr:retropepsin-like aspartic protease [Allosphingosinicella indica]SMF61075.1 aspartyl protease family protein [Allosphingosinicella indica]
MTWDVSAEWQPLALYAVVGALLLALLFRLPFIGGLLRSLFSLALLGLCLFLLLQQAPFDANLSRLTAPFGLDRQQVEGGEVRIPLSGDGHYWANVSLDGVERRMLIDSGATVTALSEATARAMALEPDAGLLPVVMQTAGGLVTVRTATLSRMQLGPIEARNLKVVISPALGDFDVLGMNFLSRLAGWRVENSVLILTGSNGTADSNAVPFSARSGA